MLSIGQHIVYCGCVFDWLADQMVCSLDDLSAQPHDAAVNNLPAMQKSPCTCFCNSQAHTFSHKTENTTDYPDNLK